MKPFEILPAEDRDTLGISILLQSDLECPVEARVMQGLRQDGAIALELVARSGRRVIGHAAFVWLTEPRGWAALAPLSVKRGSQNGDVREALVRAGIDRLRRRHVPAILVLGDPRDYREFGFSLDQAETLSSVYPKENLMVLPFRPNLTGRSRAVVYPEAFFRGAAAVAL